MSQYKSSNSRSKKSLVAGNAAPAWHHSLSNEAKYSGSSADQYGFLFRVDATTLVLTLQASNLTSEDLTLTVLAPASFAPPPSLLSLSSSPSSPVSPLVNPPESTARLSSDKENNAEQSMSSVPADQGHGLEGRLPSASINNQDIPMLDVLPGSDLGCSHLWLQSRVPLGCVPSQSTATIKLEVLPLTDGIITLDSLQIDVKEKAGVAYVPEHSLKINATSSITTGII